MSEGFYKDLIGRVLVLDGALGTMIQQNNFTETDFRGRVFLNHAYSLSGFYDILNITKPSAVKKIHSAYLEAGADIISTNTFNANAISMRNYGLDKDSELIYKINKEGAILAKEALKSYESLDVIPKKHYVAGSVGPTNCSLTNESAYEKSSIHRVYFEELTFSYETQIAALIEGGIDILMFETFFDSLNLKAALTASDNVMRNLGIDLPIMISLTVSGNEGNLFSGESLNSFLTKFKGSNDKIVSIGINCLAGSKQWIKYIDNLSTHCNHFISFHPNAGLPDKEGNYDITPGIFGNLMNSILKKYTINIIGGCCGTTPEHIKAIRAIVDRL